MFVDDPYGDLASDPMGEEFSGDSHYEGPAESYSASDLRERINNLQAHPEMDQGALDQLLRDISAAQALSPEKRAQELARIAMAISEIESPRAGDPNDPFAEHGMEEEGEKPVDLGELEDQLKDFKRELGRMDNLTEDELIEKESKIDRWLTEIKLAEKAIKDEEPHDIDVEGILMELEEMKGQAKELNEYSPGQKGLAEVTGMTPEEIANKAKAAGVDMDNLTVPPSQALLDFLLEISPELKEKAKAVEKSTSDRITFYQNELRAANKQNDDNTRSTTDSDNMDVTHWQNLYDLRWMQDEKSKTLTSAMKSFTETIIPILEGLYPGQEIKPMENISTGWDKEYKDARNGDVLLIDGQIVDLFDHASGKLHSSGESEHYDVDVEIKIPTIRYDGSGTGAWKPENSWFNLYGNSSFSRHYYDDDEMGGD